MKINRTKFRETIEISAKELDYMLFARSSKLREYASEILTILKRSNQHNDKPDDHMFDFRSDNKTAGKKAPDMTKGTLAELINSLDKDVDKKFKEYGNREVKIGVDLAEEGAEDESCILTALKALNKEVDESMRPANVGVRIKRPISIHEIKVRTGIVEDIKKKEREKIEKEIKVLRGYYTCYNCLDWNVMPDDKSTEAINCKRKVESERKRGALTALDELIRLIRKEQIK